MVREFHRFPLCTTKYVPKLAYFKYRTAVQAEITTIPALNFMHTYDGFNLKKQRRKQPHKKPPIRLGFK